MTDHVLAAAPALPSHELLVFLLQVAVLLLGAFALGRLAQRLGLPAIVGELLTGVVIGPSVLGHALPDLSAWFLPSTGEQQHLLDATCQIGVLLLVGVTGTHLDAAMLRRRGGSALTISICGLAIPLVLGLAAGTLMPAGLIGDGTPRWVFALFLGTAMSVSAIPVIAKTLSDMRLLHRDIGQLVLAAGTVDDAIGWFLLSVVSAAATVGVTAARVTAGVAYLIGFIALAVLIGRPLVRRALSLAARSPEAGPSTAVAVVLILLGGALTQALGMEPVFGAFIAGILVGLPGAGDQRKLAPLRTVVMSVLAPLFIASAGLRMDLSELRRPSIALAALAVLAIAVIGKFAGAYLGARLTGLRSWEALALGAGMNARGVVEVVVATTGLRLGVLTTATYTVVVLVAVVTSLMAPPLLRLAMNHVEQNERETVRHAMHDAWSAAGSEPGDPARNVSST
ncbi:cation:proton antiporter [Actinoplanes sp. NPDC051411]|uniref:cation:proton antiporter n=1 Tax=Actinoplanes sp. NPDC051411 TaxID=3155522 RepID=UPI00342437F3